MNEIEIVVNEKVVVVAKLPLRRYAELLAAFEQLPKHFDLISGKTQAEIIQNLPELLSTCYPDIVRILQVATSMTEQEIGEMGLDDFTRVVEAIFTVNNYGAIYERIKKLGTQRTIGAEVQ